jgi:hypothetical protein
MVATLLAAGPAARAAGRARVALVGPDAELAHAVEVALTPWGVTLVREAADFHDVAAATVERARALARDERLDAVVWTAAGGAPAPTFACIYDAENDRVVTRALGGSLPFDDTTAAAAALTIKTMLRSSIVAPPEERGAPSTSDVVAAPPVAPLTAPRPSAATPSLTPPPPLGPPPNPRSPPSRRPFELEAAAGTRLLTTEAVEARIAFGVAWFPPEWGALGLGADASLGSGVSVQSPVVDARLVERAFELSLRRRVRLGASLAVIALLGAALDWTTMTGAVGPARGPLGIDRVDPSVDAALRLTCRLGPLDLGASADLGYLLRSQRYIADGVTVARLATWQPGATLWLDAALF